MKQFDDDEHDGYLRIVMVLNCSRNLLNFCITESVENVLFAVANSCSAYTKALAPSNIYY